MLQCQEARVAVLGHDGMEVVRGACLTNRAIQALAVLVPGQQAH